MSLPEQGRKASLRESPVCLILSHSFRLELGCEVWSGSRYLATRRRQARVESLPAKGPGVERRAWSPELSCAPGRQSSISELLVMGKDENLRVEATAVWVF